MPKSREVLISAESTGYCAAWSWQYGARHIPSAPHSPIDCTGHYYRNIRNFRSRHRSGRLRVTSCHVEKMMKRLWERRKLRTLTITAFKIQAEIALTGRQVPSVDTIKRQLKNQYQLTACWPEVKPELIGNNNVPVYALVENTRTWQFPIKGAYCFVLTKPFSLTSARWGFVRREKRYYYRQPKTSSPKTDPEQFSWFGGLFC